MKIVWKYSLENHKDIWTSELEGIFYSTDNTVAFYFINNNRVVALIMNKKCYNKTRRCSHV